jgi:hypothetical protein
MDAANFVLLRNIVKQNLYDRLSMISQILVKSCLIIDKFGSYIHFFLKTFKIMIFFLKSSSSNNYISSLDIRMKVAKENAY